MSEPQSPDFSELVNAYYQALYRFAHSLAGNPHEAADLTQQTFLVYARKGHHIRDPGKIKSWLFTTLYREFLRQKRRGATMVSKDHALLEQNSPVETPPLDPALDAETVHQALQSVDEVFRAALTLYYLEELSYREIAAVLDAPLGTVMSRLSRGKTQLKAYFKGRNDSPDSAS